MVEQTGADRPGGTGAAGAAQAGAAGAAGAAEAGAGSWPTPPAGTATPPAGTAAAPMGSAPAVYPAPRAGTGSEQPRASLSQGGLFVLGLVLVLLGMGAGVAIGAAVWAGGPSGPSVGFHISPSPRFGGGGGGPFGRGGPFGGQIPALPNSGSGGPSSIFRGFGLGTTGTVTAVNGNTVTVKTSNGRTFNVNVPSSATVTTTQNGSLSNVTSGSCIRVTGSGVRVTPGGSNSGNSGSGNSGTGSSGSGSSTGSLTARSVEVLPSGSADCSS